MGPIFHKRNLFFYRAPPVDPFCQGDFLTLEKQIILLDFEYFNAFHYETRKLGQTALSFNVFVKMSQQNYSPNCRIIE